MMKIVTLVASFVNNKEFKYYKIHFISYSNHFNTSTRYSNSLDSASSHTFITQGAARLLNSKTILKVKQMIENMHDKEH